MESKWHEVWNAKTSDVEKIQQMSFSEKFLELKRLNGFDVVGGGIKYDAFCKQYQDTKRMLVIETEARIQHAIKSVFEVGCGSGANLFMFENDGYRTGGIDFSESLIATAQNVLASDDLVCDEAINMDSAKRYDVILSNSVFSYFPDLAYTEQVLKKCLDKGNYAIGLMDIHDIEKKDDFIAYRKREIENYEERYRGLPKLFYKKEFFSVFAAENDMDITFLPSKVEGYWNNDFIFNVFMYKKDIKIG